MKPELQSQPELRQRSESRCILVVDDENLIRDLCKRVLADYKVLQASNGTEALEILRQQSVDVILTDVMMPDMDGLSLLKEAKEIDPTQIVIVMTGFPDKNVVLGALRENADDFLTKPLNLLQLKTTIAKALDKKRLKEELVYLRRMDHLKSDFLGLVSHKLKTPVTAISLFLQNLSSGIVDPADPEFTRHLDMTLDESKHLEALIEELLHHSEAMLRPHTNAPQQVDLNDLLSSLCADFSARTAGTAINFQCQLQDDLPSIQLDREGLQFAVTALLDNALKFSPVGGAVHLSAATDEHHLMILVTDQGQGIPREEISKVFEKFYQVDPQGTGQVRGFGLGLYYARHFANFNHGTLSLENVSSGGTIASLILPF